MELVKRIVNQQMDKAEHDIINNKLTLEEQTKAFNDYVFLRIISDPQAPYLCIFDIQPAYKFIQKNGIPSHYNWKIEREYDDCKDLYYRIYFQKFTLDSYK